MNDWRQKEIERAKLIAEKLEAIIAHLDGWSLLPIDVDKTDDWFAPRFREIVNADRSRRIYCELQHNGKQRLRFAIWHWPSYTDDTGRKVTVTPRDTYPLDAREQQPETTAALDREPKAIARQIERKMLGEYDRLWEVCAASAESSQKHYDRKQNAEARLAAATGNEYRPGRYGSTYYVRDLPGDSVRCEFRSEGDIELHLSTDETIAVIAMLRERRASNTDED